jgi:hypothetical protein
VEKEKIEKNSYGKNFLVNREAVSIMDDTHQIYQIEQKFACNSLLLPIVAISCSI